MHASIEWSAVSMYRMPGILSGNSGTILSITLFTTSAVTSVSASAMTPPLLAQ
jgi:hypothetical protein